MLWIALLGKTVIDKCPFSFVLFLDCFSRFFFFYFLLCYPLKEFFLFDSIIGL